MSMDREGAYHSGQVLTLGVNVLMDGCSQSSRDGIAACEGSHADVDGGAIGARQH